MTEEEKRASRNSHPDADLEEVVLDVVAEDDMSVPPEFRGCKVVELRTEHGSLILYKGKDGFTATESQANILIQAYRLEQEAARAEAERQAEPQGDWETVQPGDLVLEKLGYGPEVPEKLQGSRLIKRGGDLFYLTLDGEAIPKEVGDSLKEAWAAERAGRAPVAPQQPAAGRAEDGPSGEAREPAPPAGVEDLPPPEEADELVVEEEEEPAELPGEPTVLEAAGALHAKMQELVAEALEESEPAPAAVPSPAAAEAGPGPVGASGPTDETGPSPAPKEAGRPEPVGERTAAPREAPAAVPPPEVPGAPDTHPAAGSPESSAEEEAPPSQRPPAGEERARAASAEPRPPEEAVPRTRSYEPEEKVWIEAELNRLGNLLRKDVATRVLKASEVLVPFEELETLFWHAVETRAPDQALERYVVRSLEFSQAVLPLLQGSGGRREQSWAADLEKGSLVLLAVNPLQVHKLDLMGLASLVWLRGQGRAQAPRLRRSLRKLHEALASRLTAMLKDRSLVADLVAEVRLRMDQSEPLEEILRTWVRAALRAAIHAGLEEFAHQEGIRVPGLEEILLEAHGPAVVALAERLTPEGPAPRS